MPREGLWGSEEEGHSVQSGEEGCCSKFTTDYRAQRAGMAHAGRLHNGIMTDLRLVSMSGCPAQLSPTYLWDASLECLVTIATGHSPFCSSRAQTCVWHLRTLSSSMHPTSGPQPLFIKTQPFSAPKGPSESLSLHPHPHALTVLATEVPGASVVFAWAEIQSARDCTDTRLPGESHSPYKQSVHSWLQLSNHVSHPLPARVCVQG